MFIKSICVAAFALVMACFALTYSQTTAQAKNPIVDKPATPTAATGDAIIYSQPPNPAGGLVPSSWLDPNGSPSDQYVWDNFTLGSTQTITETDWMGGYDPTFFGSGGPVLDFVVGFYPSTANDTQPAVNNPLVEYHTLGNAGEMPGAILGGVQMYNYQFVLPAPFQAVGGTKYWVKIYAYQHGNGTTNIPDWGLTRGTGGDNLHFREYHGLPNALVPGDVTFTLLGPAVPISNLSATNDSPTVLGQTTTFTATVSAGSGISYTWDFGDHQPLGSGRVVTHTYTAVGSYAGIVTATNSLGSTSATTVVTITDAPVTGLTAFDDSPTALGQTTTFTATVSAGSGISYTWDFGDHQPLGNGRVVTHTYAAIGSYIGIVTATNSLGSTSATTVVTITNAPVAGLTATNNSPTPLGKVTSLTATIASGSNPIYQWNLGNGVVKQGKSVTFTYDAVGVYTAVVTASNSVSLLTATTPVTIFKPKYIYLPLILRGI